MLKKYFVMAILSFLVFFSPLFATEEAECNPAKEKCIPPQIKDDCEIDTNKPEEEQGCDEEEEEKNLLDILKNQ